MTTGVEGTESEVCPKCGRAINGDPRFVVWCDGCDWNVDPAPVAIKGRRAQRAAVKSDQLARRLYNDTVRRSGQRGGGTRVRASVFGLSGLVHLTTLALIALAAFVAIVGSGWVRIAVPIVVLGLVGYVQPLNRRRRKGWQRLAASEAPSLRSLVEEVAGAIGSPMVHDIAIAPDYNAAYTKVGVRRTLIVGLALWRVLDPQERVALIGHELGHAINGDLRRGRFVGRALVTVARWKELLQPHPIGQRRRYGSSAGTGLVAVAERILLPIILFPIFLSIETFGRKLQQLAYLQGQRCEYYADTLAAKVAGRDASIGLADKLVIADVATWALSHAAKFQRDQDPWKVVSDQVRSIPEKEMERRRRLARIRLDRIDVSHPPTQLRADHLRSLEDIQPAVTLDPETSSRIDGELSSAYTTAAALIRDRLGTT